MSVLRVSRPRILRGLRLDRNAVLEASAGTGKTYALESLVTELVLASSVDLDRVLLVTFTERATTELRDRVRARLEALQTGTVPAATESEIREGDVWTLDGPAKMRVARALHAFDGVTITTIHAFCHRLLREIAFAGGRLFDEEQIDGREAFGRSLRDGIREAAGDAVRGPWLEAGLRSGMKVGDLEELLWRCTQAHAELRPALDLEALSHALASWPIGLAQSVDLNKELRAAGTHHSTAKAIVGRIAALGDVVERAAEGRDLVGYVLSAGSLDLDEVNKKLAGLRGLSEPAARLCDAARRLASTTPPFKAALAHNLLGPVLAALGRRKRETGGYDFDDMLAGVDDALRGSRGAALAASMQRRWRYALIDEFQDTDETQWSIFRRAFFDPSGRPASTKLVLVGDPKQSIYRFRGADIATYLRAKSTLLDAGGQRLALDQTFRATESLTGALNRIFDQDGIAPVFSGEVTYAPVACGRPERKLVDGDGGEVPAVVLLRFEKELSLRALAFLVAREVERMTDPLRPWKLDDKPIAPSDVFVLTRTLREGRIIGDVLRDCGVPIGFYKEEGLFQSEEASDLAAVLAAVADPADRAKRFSAWLTPFFGLPISALERARDLPASHPLVARLVAWKALADARDFGGLFESIMRDSGIVRREIFFGSGERTITNLQHLVEFLADSAHRGHKAVDDLVSELEGLRRRTRLTLDIEGNVQRLEGDEPAVQIMTIHKAKGLEAPVVFVAGGAGAPPPDEVRVFADEGLRLAWLGKKAPERIAGLIRQAEQEEDERLMYVALTRSKARLFLPCVVDGDKAKNLRGSYDRINRRVYDLARSDPAAWASEDVAPAVVSEPPRSSANEWQPPAALFAPEASGPAYEILRSQRVGALSTSYTRMKAERRVARGEAPPRSYAPGRAAPAPRDEAGPAMLRAARGSGVFLHELLERIPLASFASSESFEAWSARADVAALVAEAMAAHRIERTQRDHAERLVWTAYTTRVDLPGGDHVDRLAGAQRVTREMRYVFPLGSGGDPADGPAEGDPERTVRGSLDVVFEHRGRAYFVDWKSDSLASYAPADLEPHVAGHYREQYELYALALVKLLGLQTESEYEERFGGMIYCFLRGFDGKGRGAWSARPSFTEIASWSRDLQAHGVLGVGEPGR